MALIKCPECSTEVSNQAKTCPKCSFPLTKKLNRKFLMGIFGGSILLFLAWYSGHYFDYLGACNASLLNLYTYGGGSIKDALNDPIFISNCTKRNICMSSALIFTLWGTYQIIATFYSRFKKK